MDTHLLKQPCYFSSSFEFCAILSSFVTYFRGLISHLLRSIKKDLQNRKVQVSIFIYALNTWIGAILAQIPASVRSGIEAPVALLSLQLVCIVESTVSHLSLENIP